MRGSSAKNGLMRDFCRVHGTLGLVAAYGAVWARGFQFDPESETQICHRGRLEEGGERTIAKEGQGARQIARGREEEGAREREDWAGWVRRLTAIDFSLQTRGLFVPLSILSDFLFSAPSSRSIFLVRTLLPSGFLDSVLPPSPPSSPPAPEILSLPLSPASFICIFPSPPPPFPTSRRSFFFNPFRVRFARFLVFTPRFLCRAQPFRTCTRRGETLLPEDTHAGICREQRAPVRACKRSFASISL